MWSGFELTSMILTSLQSQRACVWFAQHEPSTCGHLLPSTLLDCVHHETYLKPLLCDIQHRTYGCFTPVGGGGGQTGCFNACRTNFSQIREFLTECQLSHAGKIGPPYFGHAKSKKNKW